MQRTLTFPAVSFRAAVRWLDGRSVPPPSPHWPLRALALAALALTAAPLAYLGARALGAGADGLAYLVDARTLGVVWNSVALTAAVVLTASLIGVPFAWLTSCADLPLRRLWLILGLLPLVIPSYIGALTFIWVFGPRGLLAGWLRPLGVESLPPLYGFTGAWLAISLFSYPYVVLPVRAALLNLDPALEESAHSLGLSRWAVFWRVTLPQLRPALAAGGLLAALYTLSDFGAVALMRYNAFTRVIYSQYTGSLDRSRAALLAIMLVALTLGALVLARRAAAAGRGYRAGVGAQRAARPARLGRWRVPALLFCGLLVGMGVIVPVGVLASWTRLEAGAALDWTTPLLNSLGASGTTALAAALAALPLAWLAARSGAALDRRLFQASFLGNGLPGVVVALALVFITANLLPGLYQTLPVLVLGYATRFLPLSVSATHSALAQINPRLEEAGRGLGLRPWQVMARITAPLARAGILGGAALVFLNAMKELPTTLLLAPTGYTTLATRIWTAQQEVNFAQVGAPALLLVAASALSLALILKQER